MAHGFRTFSPCYLARCTWTRILWKWEHVIEKNNSFYGPPETEEENASSLLTFSLPTSLHFFHYTHLFVICARVRTCVVTHRRLSLRGVGSLFSPLCGSQGSNSGHQSWQHGLLPTLSHITGLPPLPLLRPSEHGDGDV